MNQNVVAVIPVRSPKFTSCLRSQNKRRRFIGHRDKSERGSAVLHFMFMSHNSFSFSLRAVITRSRLICYVIDPISCRVSCDRTYVQYVCATLRCN